MNAARFAELAEAYGSDLSRWPERQRSVAATWSAGRPEAQAVLAEARRLDAALATYAPHAPSMDLQRRIITNILAERRRPPRLLGWLAALAALAGAGAIGAGATVGAAVVAVAPAAQPTRQAASALYEQSSFGDFGSADDASRDPAGA